METTNSIITAQSIKAVVHHRFGDPDAAIALERIPAPTATDGHVVVRVRAAGISTGDRLTVEGIPYIARPSYGIVRPKRRIVGQQLAGVVDSVGDGVTKFRPGDEVFGFAEGALAELVIADPAMLAPKPAALDFAEAAALPVSALAAYQALTRVGGLQRGHRLLIVGASGAVGRLAVQIGKAVGADVTGVASTRSLDMVKALGADQVIDYTRESIEDAGTRFDVIVNLAGNRSLAKLRAAAASDASIVLVGATGGRWFMGSGRTLGAVIQGMFVSQRVQPLVSKPRADDLAAVAALVESGAIDPPDVQTFAMDRTSQAIRRVGGGPTAVVI